MDGASGEDAHAPDAAPDVIDRLLATEWIDAKSWSRTECSECGKKVRFFCPGCKRMIGVPAPVEHHFKDRLQLPVQLEVVIHDQETKSSGLMLPTLASPVAACRYPAELPAPAPAPPLDRWDPATACIVYPSPDATTLFDLDPDTLASIKTLVLVDCRWGSGPASPLFQNTCLKDVKHWVKLATPPDSSRFWRYHHKGAGCLSTAEAAYYIVLDYVRAMAAKGLPLSAASGDHVCSLDMHTEQRYEQLLSLFALQYQSVENCYAAGGAHHEHTSASGRITKPPPQTEEGKEYQRGKRAQPRGKAGREFHEKNTKLRQERIMELNAKNRELHPKMAVKAEESVDTTDAAVASAGDVEAR